MNAIEAKRETKQEMIERILDDCLRDHDFKVVELEGICDRLARNLTRIVTERDLSSNVEANAVSNLVQRAGDYIDRCFVELQCLKRQIQRLQRDMDNVTEG